MKKRFVLLASLFIVGTVSAQSVASVGQMIAQYHTTAIDADSLGESVALVGDVNGDGYADMLFGAPWDGEVDYLAGAAYLVLGSPAGYSLGKELDQIPALKYTGETTLDTAGISVAGAGDVNRDGFDDMLVGSPGRDGDTGAVYLILGSANPTGGSLATAIRYDGNLTNETTGTGIAGVGDANGDGFDDFLIGAPNTPGGHAYLMLGSATPAGGDLASIALNYFGSVIGSLAGFHVAEAGDTNGDGYDDMLVATPGLDTIYLILGEPAIVGGSLNSTALAYTAEDPGDQVGLDGISSAGDVNGDGYHDFLVGASGYGSTGAVYLVRGGSTPASTSLGIHERYVGDGTSGFIGEVVAPAGDANGDGYDDFLVSASQFNGTIPGGFYVQLGSSAPAGGALTSPYQFLFLNNTHVLSGGQDVNGDGFSDWLEGEPAVSRVSLIAGGHLASALPAYQHHRRLGDNVDANGRSLPAEFVQAGVQVTFVRGAQSFGDVAVTRHILHPCTKWQLSTPIWNVDTGRAFDPAVEMDVRFKYTDNHIAGMDEANLGVWVRPAGQPCSSWTEVTNITRDADHNFITAHLNGPLPIGQFTIAETEPPPTDVQFSTVEGDVAVQRLHGEPLWLVVLLAVLVLAAGAVHWRLRRA